MSRMNRQMRNAYEEAYATKAKEVKAQANKRVQYYRAYLWRLFIGSVDVEIPKDWSREYFNYWYLVNGCVGIAKHKPPYPFAYTTDKYNNWKYPKVIRGRDEVTHAAFKVGENAEILYLANAGVIYAEANYTPEDLIEITAQKLANADGCIDTNLLVSRTPWIFEVEDFKDAQSAKALFTEVMSGMPAVFRRKSKSSLEKSSNSLVTTFPVRQNLIAPDVQDCKRSILNEFLTAIGINNANTDKKERLVTDEVNANNIELETAVSMWQRNADDCCERIKDVCGVDIKIKFGGVKIGAESETDRPIGSLPTDSRRNNAETSS